MDFDSSPTLTQPPVTSDPVVSTPDRTGLVPPDTDGSAWPLPPAGERVRRGSQAHKVLLARTLLDSFDPYRPALLNWPRLTPEVRNRIVSMPIWDIAVRTEEKASRRMQAYAETVQDPLLRKALMLNAFEERRHRAVLSNLVAAYDIALQPEIAYRAPKRTEMAYMVTGFSECIDSFFAFGLFEAARRTGFFPAELVETFEPVIREEGRHILFFVNWVAWRRRQLNLVQRVIFELTIWATWVFLGAERMGLVASFGSGPPPSSTHREDANFTVSGANHVDADLSVRDLFELCLAENDRRLGAYDSRLERPMFIPRLVRLALRFMPNR